MLLAFEGIRNAPADAIVLTNILFSRASIVIGSKAPSTIQAAIDDG
jgi:hypothetical protein